MTDTTTQIKEALEDALYWIDAAGKEASMTEPKVELASGFAVRSAAHIRLALSALSAAQPLELGEEEIMGVVGLWMGPGNGQSFWMADDSTNEIEKGLKADLRSRLQSLLDRSAPNSTPA